MSKSLLLCALLALGLPALAQTPGFSFGQQKEAGDPDSVATLVVFNENDPDSKLLASFYAEKRHIPAERIIGLKCSTQEEISRADYDATIAEPLRTLFTSNFWWKLRAPDDKQGPIESNSIRFVALMKGIPVKIAPVASYPGDKPYTSTPIGTHNEAAVDSELATLALRSPVISGAVLNPYFRAYTNIREANRPDIMIVCRLDGPSPAVVRRMIVDSLATEQTGLHGMAYIDARGITNEPGLVEGDQWLLAAAQDARKHGLPVILDNGPSMFPEGYPMRYCALYLGWYSEKIAGPFVRPGFHFMPGAIAVHIHSFSASTLRTPTENWAGPLLDRGAAATMGNVYEPYLSLTPHLDVFEERLRLGFTFGEAGYASERVLSWMTTFVGDPLYRPFPPFPTLAANHGVAEWEAYKQGALKWDQDSKVGTTVLQESARKLKSGIIWEGLALLQMSVNNRGGAIDSLQEARRDYTNPEDIMRVTIHHVIQLLASGQETDAVSLAKREGAEFPASPAIGVLRLLTPAAFPVGKK